MKYLCDTIFPNEVSHDTSFKGVWYFISVAQPITCIQYLKHKKMQITILNEATLPNKYWKEVVHTIVYILNRVQVSIIISFSPYELWYVKIASIKHLKYFGCKFFIKINDDNLNNF